jgi:hypothetical protein
MNSTNFIMILSINIIIITVAAAAAAVVIILGVICYNFNENVAKTLQINIVM